MKYLYKILISGLLAFLPSLVGCQSAATQTPIDRITEINECHVNTYGNFDLPRKIGSVENIGLQLPAISPDGETMLYLRSDRTDFSRMTLLGSSKPEDTPVEGTLTIWIRPVSGNVTGKPFSTERWAHSPVWSRNGKAVAYVINELAGSMIVYKNLADGTQCILGRKNAFNCLPRFGDDDQTILFCAAEQLTGPFRIFRQRIDENQPTVMSPEGLNCLLPVLQKSNGDVVCAVADGEQIKWMSVNVQGTTDINVTGGSSNKSSILQTWAGIGEPVSPSWNAFIFYDEFQNRICVYHFSERKVRKHRSESIAACWLDDQAIAIATSDRVFLVSTQTGMSLELFNGLWIPSRYLPIQKKLFLLGRENSRRFSIVEVQFRERIKK